MQFLKKLGSLPFSSVAAAAVAVLFISCASSKQNYSSMIVSDVQEFDVDGVHIIMRQSTETPVVSAVLFIKGGESVEPRDEPLATEYFTMRIASGSGTQRTSKAYFRRKMVSMGSGISGENGRDYSALSMMCTRENFDTTWGYFTDIMLHPAFDEVEFQNMRKNVSLGINARESEPENYSNIEGDSLYFYGHPYGRTLNHADADSVTIPLMEHRWKQLMVKSRFLLSVVGNVSREELTQKIKESIGTLPEGSYTPVHLQAPEKAFSPGLYYPPYDRKLPTDYVVGYYLAPSKGDSDYYPYLRLRNFFGGFVFNHIRVEHNLAYAPNVEDRDGATTIGEISFQTPYVDSAVKLVYKDVDFFQQNFINAAAIKEGVAGWATRNYLNAETTSQQAVNLGQAKLMTGDWHNAFFNYEKLASVTPQQIYRAANKYLRNFNWVVIGDTTNINRELLESR